MRWPSCCPPRPCRGWTGHSIASPPTYSRRPSASSRRPGNRKKPGTGELGLSRGTGPASETGGPGTRSQPGEPVSLGNRDPGNPGSHPGPRSTQGSDLLGVVSHPGDVLGDLSQGPLPVARLVPG